MGFGVDLVLDIPYDFHFPFFFLGFLSFSAKPAARPRGPEPAQRGARGFPRPVAILAHFGPDALFWDFGWIWYWKSHIVLGGFSDSGRGGRKGPLRPVGALEARRGGNRPSTDRAVSPSGPYLARFLAWMLRSRISGRFGSGNAACFWAVCRIRAPGAEKARFGVRGEKWRKSAPPRGDGHEFRRGQIGAIFALFFRVEKGPKRPQTRAAIFGPRGKVLRRAADFRGGGGPQFGPHPGRISAAMKGLFCKKGQKLGKNRKNRGFIDPSIKRRTGTLRRRLSGKKHMYMYLYMYMYMYMYTYMHMYMYMYMCMCMSM